MCTIAATLSHKEDNLEVILYFKIILFREAFKKKNKKCGYFPPLGPPPLKCGNTFWGEKIFLQFHPENDLPTCKN